MRHCTGQVAMLFTTDEQYSAAEAVHEIYKQLIVLGNSVLVDAIQVQVDLEDGTWYGTLVVSKV